MRSPTARFLSLVSLVGIALAWAASPSPAASDLVPSGRTLPTVVYDPVTDRMIVFGGYDGNGGLGDLHALTLRPEPVWTPIQASNDPLIHLYGHSSVYDKARNRVVLFGGVLNSVSLTNHVWALTLGPNPSWSTLTVGGTPPTPRSGHTAVYDYTRDRMLVFGGNDGAEQNDVWELDFSPRPYWLKVYPGGIGPTAREGHTAVYDGFYDRMVVFGGNDGTNDLNDLWALLFYAGPNWVQLSPGPGPSARRQATSIYDPLAAYMWLFGGVSGASQGNQDVWFLDLNSRWTQLTPSGTPPSPRWGCGLTRDNAGRLLVFGGQDANHYFNETWALQLYQNPAWSQLQYSVPVPAGPSWIESEEIAGGVRLAWFVPDGNAAEIQRRTAESGWRSLTWQTADGSDRVTYDDLTVAAGTRYGYRIEVNGTPYGEAWITIPAAGLALAGFTANPAPSHPSVSFRLASGEPARLGLVDLKGRLVFQREVGSLGPGDHTVAVDGASLRAGVYWIQLRQGAAERRVKGIVLP